MITTEGYSAKGEEVSAKRSPIHFHFALCSYRFGIANMRFIFDQGGLT